jgi:hypothetical protein
MREQCTVIFWTWVCMVGGVINPFAVAGALIGTCFFLASPKATTLGQKIYLGLFSCGMGFGGGIFFYPGGPPWSEKAMIVSGAIAALIATVFTAAGYMVDSKGGLPKWVTDILGYVPFIKRRSNSDGP